VASGLASAQQMSPFPNFDGTLPVEEGELPGPDQAFKPTAIVRNGTTVVVQFSPAAGYYLYRDRISCSVASDDEIIVANVELPAGTLKKDPSYGDTMVFDQPFSMVVNLTRKSDSPSRLTLQVTTWVARTVSAIRRFTRFLTYFYLKRINSK